MSIITKEELLEVLSSIIRDEEDTEVRIDASEMLLGLIELEENTLEKSFCLN